MSLRTKTKGNAAWLLFRPRSLGNVAFALCAECVAYLLIPVAFGHSGSGLRWLLMLPAGDLMVFWGVVTPALLGLITAAKIHQPMAQTRIQRAPGSHRILWRWYAVAATAATGACGIAVHAAAPTVGWLAAWGLAVIAFAPAGWTLYGNFWAGRTGGFFLTAVMGLVLAMGRVPLESVLEGHGFLAFVAAAAIAGFGWSRAFRRSRMPFRYRSTGGAAAPPLGQAGPIGQSGKRALPVAAERSGFQWWMESLRAAPGGPKAALLFMPILASLGGLAGLLVMKLSHESGRFVAPAIIITFVAAGVFNYPSALPLRYPVSRRRLAEIRWAATLFNLASFVLVFCAMDIPMWMLAYRDTPTFSGTNRIRGWYILTGAVVAAFWIQAIWALLEMAPQRFRTALAIAIGTASGLVVVLGRGRFGVHGIRQDAWIPNPWLIGCVLMTGLALGVVAYRWALTLRYARADLPKKFSFAGPAKPHGA